MSAARVWSIISSVLLIVAVVYLVKACDSAGHLAQGLSNGFHHAAQSLRHIEQQVTTEPSAESGPAGGTSCKPSGGGRGVIVREPGGNWICLGF